MRDREITPEQKVARKKLRVGWFRHARRTDPIDPESAENAVKNLYGFLGRPFPRIIRCASPIAGMAVVATLRGHFKFHKSAASSPDKDTAASRKIFEGVSSDLRPSPTRRTVQENAPRVTPAEGHTRSLKQVFGRFVENTVGQFRAEGIGKPCNFPCGVSGPNPLCDVPRPGVRHVTDPLMTEYIGRPLGAGMRNWLMDEWPAPKRRTQWPLMPMDYYMWENVPWLMVYEFRRHILEEPFSNRDAEFLAVWHDLLANTFWIFPFDNACILSDRPAEIILGKGTTGPELHNLSGPAVVFRDGVECHILHGVHVAREVITTPGDQLDCSWVLRTTYPPARRDIVQKIGLERVCRELSARITDRRDNYELLELQLHDGWRRPFLRMRNPSTGEFHVEGVHPDCDSVPAALMWRNGTDIAPAVLT
ncbi:MAG: hypothetical protein V2B18_23050 [Pseudomonadota bacterium]